MENSPELKKFRESCSGRQVFKHEGLKIYEWEQTLEDVLVYIDTPEVLLEKNREIIRKNLKQGQEMPKLEVKFTSTKLLVGLKGNPPYLNEELFNKIKESECLWQIDGGEITITMPKAYKGETWPLVFKGHEQLNPIQMEEIRKKLLKERFQEEHGGFDFSDAEMSGNVPDPRTFMGGLNYTK